MLTNPFMFLSLIFSVLIGIGSAMANDEASRTQHLYKMLRCQTCQGESIDESQAPLAKQMRSLVLDQMHAGKSDDDIIRFLVERYGQSILMTTPVTPSTLLLWLLPALGCGVGFVLLYRRVMRSKRP